jgi:hypothetical protein
MRKIFGKKFVAFCLVSSCFLVPEISLAQEANSEEVNNHEAEKRRLQEQIEIQELRNKLENLQQGNTTQSSPSRLDGKVELPQNVPLYEGRTLVYEALDSVSSALARDIVNKLPLVCEQGCSNSSETDTQEINIVVYDDSSFSEIEYYRAYDLIRQYIIQIYYEQFEIGTGIAEGETGFAPVIGSLNLFTKLGESLVSFMSLFRTNRTFQVFPLEVSHSHLVSLLSQDLEEISKVSLQYKFKVYEPEQYSFAFSNDFGATTDGTLANLLKDISRIEELNHEADEKLLQLSGSNLNSSDIQNLEEFSKFAKDFVKALSTIDTESNTYNLFRLAKAKQLSELISGDGTFVLKLNIIGAEVDQRTTQNLFTGSQLSYSAGVIAEYKVFNGQSELSFADVLYNQTGYTSGAQNNTEP